MSFARPTTEEHRERRAAERAANLRALATATLRPVSSGQYAGATTGPAPKENVLESAAYEAAVRRLPCARCGIVGFTQFCHTDMNKGMGIKTDVRRGWAGCGPRETMNGCHWIVGTSGQIKRAARRILEAGYAAWTRAEVLRRGWWPKKLPVWEDTTP